MEEEKIPIETVLDDMYGDYGVVSYAARDYYKLNYATPEELIIMEREEKREYIFAIVFWIILIGAMIGVSICDLIF